MSNPVEDYLELREGTEKTAGIFDTAAKAAKGAVNHPVGAGVLGSLGAAGIMAAGSAAEKAYYAITKKRDFDAMLDANPDLQDAASERPKVFNMQYNSFRKMNPEFAADPIVAGTYMRQMDMNPTGAGRTIVEAMGARKGLPQKALQFKPLDMQRALQYNPYDAEKQDMQRAMHEQRMAKAQSDEW